jgi:outer membrane biosynthesis protein TonB
MMMGMSQTGRGGLGFSAAPAPDADEQTQSVLRKLNPSKKADPKKWGQMKDIPPPSTIDEAAPKRQTMSLWVDQPKETKEAPEAKKAKKEKKEKKEKKDKAEKKVQLARVDLEEVAKAAGKVLAKSDGMSMDNLVAKTAKKVSGAELTHLLDALLGDKFAYGLMLKATGSASGEVGAVVAAVLKKADDWMDLAKTAKKSGKKLSREVSSRDVLTAVGGCDGVVVHIYNK